MESSLNDVHKHDIDTIQQWLITQPHLPEISESDVKMFLHCNYSDVEAAKKTIENYYTFRTSCKDFFANRDVDDPEIKTAMSLMMFAVLPKSTPEGYRIGYCRLIDSDTTNYVHLQTVRMLVMCIDLWLKEEPGVPGHVILVDMVGMHLGHLAKLKMSVLRNYSYYVQEAVPLRLKNIHFINTVSFVDKLMFLIKPLLKKHIAELINLHADLETLFRFVPRENLPHEYGGNAGTVEELRCTFNQKLHEMRAEFLEREKREAVDESKRIAKPRRFLFGLFGN